MTLFRRPSLRLALVDDTRTEVEHLGHVTGGRRHARSARARLAAERGVSSRQIRVTRTAPKGYTP